MRAFKIAEYQKMARRTSPDDGHDRMQNAIFGLIGETGEIADLYKKWAFQSTPGTPMPAERMMEEAGDVMWYMAELAAGMGIGLDEAMGAETFEEFDAYLLKRRNSARNENVPRMILAMASEATAISYHARRKETGMTRQKMKNMMVALGSMALKLGGNTGGIARGNIEKLKKRYPQGFDAKISMGRYE